MTTLRIEEAPREGLLHCILGVYNNIDHMTEAIKEYMLARVKKRNLEAKNGNNEALGV